MLKVLQHHRRRQRGLYRILSRNYQRLPILSVHKSNKYIYMYLNDHESASTIISFMSAKKNIDSAKSFAQESAKKIIDRGVNKIVFNKNGYKFHGIVKTIYDTVKEVGISC